MTDSYHFQIEPEPRAEVPKFRIGGVYRDGRDSIYMLREAVGEKLAMAVWWDPCRSEFDVRGEPHRLDNGRFDALRTYEECHWHLVPGELTLRDGQWIPLEQTASLTFPSGATLKVAGDKIVGRVEASPATYDVSVGKSLLTAEELNSAIRAVLDSFRAQDTIPEPIRPALDWDTATPFDPFGADFIVTKGAEPTAPLHTSPTTDSAYPAIAGLLRG